MFSLEYKKIIHGVVWKMTAWKKYKKIFDSQINFNLNLSSQLLQRQGLTVSTHWKGFQTIELLNRLNYDSLLILSIANVN